MKKTHQPKMGLKDFINISLICQAYGLVSNPSSGLVKSWLCHVTQHGCKWWVAPTPGLWCYEHMYGCVQGFLYLGFLSGQSLCYMSVIHLGPNNLTSFSLVLADMIILFLLFSWHNVYLDNLHFGKRDGRVT